MLQLELPSVSTERLQKHRLETDGLKLVKGGARDGWYDSLSVPRLFARVDRITDCREGRR